MHRLKVYLTLSMKSDPEDLDMLEQDIREELRALAEEEGELEYRVKVEDAEEDEDFYS